MRRIIGIGETVLDVIFRDDKPQDAIPGGSTFNSLISLGRTLPKKFPGIQISMVTETGADHIGDIIVSFMESNGVGTEFVTRNQGTQSHLSMAFLDNNNDAQYEFYKDHANAGLSAAIVNEINFTKDDIVLFGSFFAINPVIRNYTRAILKKAHDAGAILYYDINFRRNHIKDLPETLDNILENCTLADFVRGSSEDFFYLFGMEDGKEIYEKHISQLCSKFILTRGSLPIEVYSNGVSWTFPVKQIETISTIGAGDNFNAGFIYSLVNLDIWRDGILSYNDWTSILSVASKFSSSVCQSIYNYVDTDFVKQL